MELNIYVKNVGQGDTIFLSWGDPGKTERKHALIDCNLYNRSIRPVIDHIEALEISKLEFVILSHPHTDHFSGFIKFFEYCQEKDISIDKFFYTSPLDPLNLNQIFGEEVSVDQRKKIIAFAVAPQKQSNLFKFYELLYEQHKLKGDGFIKSVFAMGNDYPIPLGNSVVAQFLSPFSDEINEYLNHNYNVNVVGRDIEMNNKTENNPAANYLSSVLQIRNDDKNWLVLLCSDAMNFTFDRVLNHDQIMGELQQKRLIAAQIPHHGSNYNHHAPFWDSLTYDANVHFVVSVGNRYGHPNRNVIDYFRTKTKLGNVHSTNFVGGYKESYSHNEVDLSPLLNVPGVTFSVESQHSARSTCSGKRFIIDTENGTCKVKKDPH